MPGCMRRHPPLPAVMCRLQAGEPCPVGLEMYNALTRLQTEQEPDPFGWVHPVV